MQAVVFTESVLFPERCVAAQLLAAIADGAQARFGARVAWWGVPGADRVEVGVDGETIEARRLVVCAGAWLGQVAADLQLPLRVERNVQFWFAPKVAASAAPSSLPIFALERDELPFMFYGLADFGTGVKCAFHHSDDNDIEIDARLTARSARRKSKLRRPRFGRGCQTRRAHVVLPQSARTRLRRTSISSSADTPGYPR